MAESSIEWTDATWNPVIGCERVSPGCENCYAERMAFRLEAMGQKRYVGLTRKTDRGRIQWTGTARFVPEVLGAPLKWRKPQRIFVNSMSDLFHHDVTNEEIAAVFGVMAACPQHTFQILTKRPERMAEWFDWAKEHGDGQDLLRGDMPSALLTCGWEANCGDAWGDVEVPERLALDAFPTAGVYGTAWPLPNVWLGVSCENQETANKRIPLLLQVPAAIRFVSAEPLLGPILFDNGESSWLTCDGRNKVEGHCCEAHDVHGEHFHGIDWVICGGESGHGARESHAVWHHSIGQQCHVAGVAFFEKQLGANVRDRNDAGFDGEPGDCWPAGTEAEDIYGSNSYQSAPVRIRLKDRKGGDINEWPDALRFRQMPGVRDG